MRLLASILLITSTLFGVDLKTYLENSNILGYQKYLGTVDYNRLRLYANLTDKRYADTNIYLILDNVNIYSFKNRKNSNKTNIYRTYIEYTGEKHAMTLGLQRVAFGTGRIWNPIDVFNPIDITKVEPNERKGTNALHYEYAINSLSNLDLTISKNRHAIRVKSFLDVADVALILIKDNKNTLNIIGYEVEGELLNTDITLRSEGGGFWDKKRDNFYYSYIIGAEYGFENSFIILTEFYHNTNLKSKELALNLSYQPSALWFLNFLAIKSLVDESGLISPSFTYSLNDESSLQIGAFITDREDQFFMRYFVNF